MKRGKLLVISGFSGVGKGTVIKALLKKYPDYILSISATTRSPRKGEVEGVHYFFRSQPEFEHMIQNDELLEYARYVGNYYGTPKKYVEDSLEAGKNVILEIEAQGALQIKNKVTDAIMIFILPPNARLLKERLSGRKTESRDVILQRLIRAGEETKSLENYQYFVLNRRVDECAENIHRIIRNDSPILVGSREVFRIKNDIKNLVKGEQICCIHHTQI